MEKLSHRERVLLALAHQDTDRVPMDLCGSTCNIVDPLYFKVKEALGIRGDIAPCRAGRTCTYYDERVLEALDTDFRHVAIGSPKGYKLQIGPDGRYVDEWGVTLRLVDNEVQCLHSPLEEAEDASEVLRYAQWPDTRDKSRVEGLKERVEYLRRHTDYAVSAKFVTSVGFLEHGGYLRGFQNFLCDLAADEDMANAICDRVMQIKLDLYNMMLEAVDGDVDVVELSEDFGAQNGLLISPATFRKYMQPRYKRIIGSIRERAPKAKIFFHTCGGVFELIPDLIDTGVDILNPLQPLAAGMDSKRIKDSYGDRLCFHGAIDLQRAMPGSLADVRAEVERRVDALYRDGGYILAPANHLQADTPPENVLELFRYAKAYSAKKRA
ncbi:MAG: uroporphyrinogen decarboxylase family protein [Clostridia bacterium]|nr:uroporphyrinogen decarboxylase family protein [Clostridia bacterium]